MRDQWQRSQTTRKKSTGKKRRARARGEIDDSPNRQGSKRRRKLTQLEEEETDRMLDLVETGLEQTD